MTNGSARSAALETSGVVQIADTVRVSRRRLRSCHRPRSRRKSPSWRRRWQEWATRSQHSLAEGCWRRSYQNKLSGPPVWCSKSPRISKVLVYLFSWQLDRTQGCRCSSLRERLGESGRSAKLLLISGSSPAESLDASRERVRVRSAVKVRPCGLGGAALPASKDVATRTKWQECQGAVEGLPWPCEWPCWLRGRRHFFFFFLRAQGLHAPENRSHHL